MLKTEGLILNSISLFFMISRYQQEKPLNDRKYEAQEIIMKNPGHIPVIVDRDPNCNLDQIEKQKFLVPSDLSISQFIYVVRRRIMIQPSDTVFLFANKKLLPPNSSMGQIYEENKSNDGFLYCMYSSDSAYG